jgi:hypothetical protein
MGFKNYWDGIKHRLGKTGSETEDISGEELEEVVVGHTIAGREIKEWRRKERKDRTSEQQEHQAIGTGETGLPKQPEKGKESAPDSEPVEEGRLKAEEAIRERLEKQLPLEAAEGAQQETLQRNEVPVEARLRVASREFRQQLADKAGSTKAFGRPAARLLVDFSAGFVAGAGSRMALSWAVRKGFRHFLDLSAPGMGAAVGATVGASMETWKAVREERKRLAAERQDYRQELEGLVGAQRCQKLFELRGKEDIEGLKRSDPQTAEVLEKMRRSGISWKKVAKSFLRGAAAGALGGALGGLVAEHLGWTAKAAEGAPSSARETAKAAKQVALEHWRNAEVSREMRGSVWNTVREYLEERGIQKPSNALVNEATRMITDANNVEITGDHATAAAEAVHHHLEGGIKDVAMQPGHGLGHFEDLNELIKRAGGSPAVEKIEEVLNEAPVTEAIRTAPKAAGITGRDYAMMAALVAEVAAIGYVGRKLIKKLREGRKPQRNSAAAPAENIASSPAESAPEPEGQEEVPGSTPDSQETIVVPPGRLDGAGEEESRTENAPPQEDSQQPESAPKAPVSAQEPDPRFSQARILPAFPAEGIMAKEKSPEPEKKTDPVENKPGYESIKEQVKNALEEICGTLQDALKAYELSHDPKILSQAWQKCGLLTGQLGEFSTALPKAEQDRMENELSGLERRLDLIVSDFKKIKESAPAAPIESGAGTGGTGRDNDGKIGQKEKPDQPKTEAADELPQNLSPARDRSLREKAPEGMDAAGLDLGKYALLTQERAYGSPVWSAVEAGRLTEAEALDVIGKLMSVGSWKDAAKPKNIGPLVEIFTVLLNKKNSKGRLYPQVDSLVGELKSLGPAMQEAFRRARQELES